MENLYATRVQEMENGELAAIMKLVDRNDIISFAGGIPANEIFPVEELSDLVRELLEDKGPAVFQYSSTAGSDILREYLVSFMGDRHILTSKNNILITTGSQQALDLISKVFVDPGDKVFVEKPGYVGGIGAIKSYEADLMGIEMDNEGLRTDILREQLQLFAKKGARVKFIYLVPDYSNPSGARLSLERRKELLELASRYDFYIIEDTPYSELNYYGERLPFLKEMDDDNRVIFLGTFSKFFIPGMRIGWICGDKRLIELLGRAKQNTDLASNTFGQYLIALAGERGLVDRQIERVKPYYRQKLEVMAEAMDRYLPDSVIWNRPEGGFFFWIKLPDNVTSKELLELALKEKVAFVTGNSFFPVFEDGNHYARISFCNTPQEQIEEGIKILGNLILKF